MFVLKLFVFSSLFVFLTVPKTVQNSSKSKKRSQNWLFYPLRLKSKLNCCFVTEKERVWAHGTVELAAPAATFSPWSKNGFFWLEIFNSKKIQVKENCAKFHISCGSIRDKKNILKRSILFSVAENKCCSRCLLVL